MSHIFREQAGAVLACRDSPLDATLAADLRNQKNERHHGNGALGLLAANVRSCVDSDEGEERRDQEGTRQGEAAGAGNGESNNDDNVDWKANDDVERHTCDRAAACIQGKWTREEMC